MAVTFLMELVLNERLSCTSITSSRIRSQDGLNPTMMDSCYQQLPFPWQPPKMYPRLTCRIWLFWVQSYRYALCMGSPLHPQTLCLCTSVFTDAVMSLVLWQDPIPFHFCIFSISALTLTYYDARNRCDASRDHTRARCLIFVKSLLLATPLFSNVQKRVK